MASCPNLFRLVNNDSEEIPPDTLPEATARKFIDQDPLTFDLRPWTYDRTLKILKVRITEVPPFVGPSAIVQRKQHECLAQLENLEVLSLGYWPRNVVEVGDEDEEEVDAAFQPTRCLVMTFASGLGKLDQLKNLKVLNLNGMKHGLGGEEEAIWMTEHWPQLRVVYGLDSESKAGEWFAQTGLSCGCWPMS